MAAGYIPHQEYLPSYGNYRVMARLPHGVSGDGAVLLGRGGDAQVLRAP
jgi:hypothetical protein